MLRGDGKCYALNSAGPCDQAKCDGGEVSRAIIGLFNSIGSFNYLVNYQMILSEIVNWTVSVTRAKIVLHNE